MHTNETDIKYNLCVIGAGPLGIIVTLEYARLNPDKKLLLIEFGEGPEDAENILDKSIAIENTINHHPPNECTNKGFGGTSATWGGRCVMYDEVDFIDRPVLNNGCTWDSGLFKELQEYLPVTAEYFECGNPEFDVNNISEFANTHIAQGFLEGNITDNRLERWSTPTRFGKRYLKQLDELPNVTLIQGYQAIGFCEPDANGIVEELIVRRVKNGETTAIKSNNFVLAAGTQETTRILLKNKQLFNNLPAPPASLGKYYQGHISGKIASVKFNGNPKKTEYGFLKDKNGIYLRRRIQFSTDFLVKNNLLNAAIWLDNPLYHNPAHRNGAMSFMYVAMITPFIGKRLAPPAIAHSITKGKVNGIWQHFFNIIKDFPFSILTPAKIFYRRYFLKRKLPGVFLYNPQNRYALHFHAEQVPQENNSMEISFDGETLKINYTISDEDVNSVILLHDALDKSLRANKCGQLEYWYKKEDLAKAIKQMSRHGIHQSGTTRIAKSPDDGVVDRNLLLFGTKNIYVCSCSIFPTSGQANPTFFAGAFAARLAKHLN